MIHTLLIDRPRVHIGHLNISVLDKMIKRSFQPTHLKVLIPSIDIAPGDIASGGAPYAIKEYETLRDEVNAAKALMDPLFSAPEGTAAARDWGMAQGIFDTYKPLMWSLRDDYRAQHVTNAWMKYYEMYIEFDLVPPRGRYVAFFNAELPGAAVCAFNHYVKTKRRDLAAEWYGASIVPNHESDQDTSTVLGDKYGIYKHNTARWLMHFDPPAGEYNNNGDATLFENLVNYEARVGPNSPVGGVDLYSHDAGIDVTGTDAHGLQFNRQEQLNGKIHFGCAMAGLMTLKIGGAFIAKQYTALETYSWNLIIIYASMFEKFYLSKPLTSRPYNSEMYLVGVGFKGMPTHIREAFARRLANWSEAPLLSWEDCKTKFAPALAECTRFQKIYCKRTIDMIRENVDLFTRYSGRMHMLKRDLEQFRRQRVIEWLTRYPVVPIAPADILPSN